MNIHQVGQDIFRFRIWNLLGPFDGHITLWWHRESGKYVVGKHGNFAGLTSYAAIEPHAVVPTKEQAEFLKPIIEKELKYAYFYDSDKRLYWGKFLIHEMQKREDEGEYFGVRGRIVWQADEPLERMPEEKALDEEAIAVLEKELI